MGKRITPAQSTTICRVYKETKGKWDKIMAHPDVKATGLQRHQVERHVNYKKSQLPKKKDPQNHDRSEKARKKVLQNLEALLDEDEDGQCDISSTSYHLSLSSDEDEPKNPLKRTNGGEDDDDAVVVLKKPKLKRQLSDASMYLDDLTRDLLSTSVASTDVQSADDMIKIKQETKALTKKEVRSSRIAEKERESKAIASSLKKHQETVESQTTVQSTMQMTALQMMQKMMKADDSPDVDDDVQRLERDVRDLKYDMGDLKDEMQSIGHSLNKFQDTQSQLVALLSEMKK